MFDFRTAIHFPGAPLVLLVTATLFVSGSFARAQCDTAQVPQFTVGPRGGTELASSKVLPVFAYEMHYDSCRTLYRVAEIKKNKSPIWLRGWCRGQIIKDLEESELSDSSRTEHFVVEEGDTLSIYRELAWTTPNDTSRANGYYALDTLDYTIELIDANGVRISRLDSIGVLRRTTIGTPTLYGQRSLIALVEYIVPDSLDGDLVALRFQVRARGSGSYRFLRHSAFGLALGDRLTNQTWIDYAEEFAPGLGKRRSVEELSEVRANAPKLEVNPNPATQWISISVASPPGAAPLSVGIFDGNGELVFSPLIVPSSNGREMTCRSRIEIAGVYFVALFHGGRIVSSKKVVVKP